MQHEPDVVAVRWITWDPEVSAPIGERIQAGGGGRRLLPHSCVAGSVLKEERNCARAPRDGGIHGFFFFFLWKHFLKSYLLNISNVR